MSTQSLQYCDAKRTKIKCSGSCLVAMAYGTSGKKDVGYAKGCWKTCSAYDVPICNHHNVKCEVSCCSSDYCNSNLLLTSIPTTPLPRPKPPEPVTSHVCYQCLSRHSFEDCDRRRVKVKCKNWQPCVKASSEEYYFKGCTTTCVASKIWICNLRNVDCRVHCCYSDLCNDASIPKDSGLILIVIANFMYFFGL